MMDGISNWKDVSLSKCEETVKDEEARSAVVHGLTNSDNTEVIKHACTQ